MLTEIGIHLVLFGHFDNRKVYHLLFHGKVEREDPRERKESEQ